MRGARSYDVTVDDYPGFDLSDEKPDLDLSDEKRRRWTWGDSVDLSDENNDVSFDNYDVEDVVNNEN